MQETMQATIRVTAQVPKLEGEGEGEKTDLPGTSSFLLTRSHLLISPSRKMAPRMIRSWWGSLPGTFHEKPSWLLRTWASAWPVCC